MGRAVVADLVADGVRPVVVTRRGQAVPGADAVAADIADTAVAAGVLAGASVVFQCAQPAYHRWPEEFPDLQGSVVSALTGTDALLVAVENLYGYGPVSGPLHEGLPLQASTRKGSVRAAMWEALAVAHREGRVRTVAARAADFIGPGVEGSAVGERFFRALLTGRAVEVLGDPDALHTYTYVPDLAASMVTLAGAPDAWGRAWHVPSAPPVQQRHLVERAAALAGVRPQVRRVGPVALRLAGLFSPGAREMVELLHEFTDDFVVDHGDWSARFGTGPTPLDAALEATIASYRQAALASGTER